MFYSVLRHAVQASTPQQFYSQHLVLIASLPGLFVGYLVSRGLTGVGASWIWVPLAIAFAVRVLAWRASESVLVHTGTFEHFFMVSCQIQNWRGPAFESHCLDKMLMTPLFMGGVAYSIGAIMCGLTQRYLPGNLGGVGPKS